MNDPRLQGGKISWLWSWTSTEEGKKPASIVAVAFPVLAFVAGIALTFVPFTASVTMAKVLWLVPFPLLLLAHIKGRRGFWSVVGLLVAVLPYLILIAGLFMPGKSAAHIPL